MYSKKIPSILRITELSDQGINLSVKYFNLSLLTIALNMISSTFIILFVIDIVGIKSLGLILSISFVVSAVTDYPTGVFADWLGHKWVLAVAYVLFSISSVMLIFADSLNDLILTYIVLALANGQASGALQSWFDNNYKIHCHAEDPKHEIYREFLGRSRMFFQYTGSIVFLLGGLVASFLDSGRKIIFGIQAIGMLGVAIIFVLVLNNTHDEKSENEKGYFELLKEGILFSISSKMIIFYVLSSVILIAIFIVWYNLILFVVYYGYTGSDAGAGALRWLIWFAGAILVGKAGTLSKNLDEKSWIPRLSFIFVMIFFGLTAIVIAISDFDHEDSAFNLFGVISIFIIFMTAGFFMNIYNFLTQKLFLDIVPDNLRNSVYSLLPTIGFLLGAALIYLIGFVIENNGFAWGIVIIIFIALIGVIFEFIALRLYEPSEVEEEIEMPDVLFDTYSIANFDAFMHQIPKTWQFSSDVQLIWDRLMRVALHDHIIDEDEKDLLDSIMTHLKEYGKILEDALEDHIITEEEKIELLLARNKLIEEAHIVAGKDEVITEEEAKILDKLMKIVHELHLDHHAPDFTKIEK